MSINSQQYANLTHHAYGEEAVGKKGQMQHLVGDEVTLEGMTYKVLEYMDQPSGYQGAIYQRVDTGGIVVAHRGTELDRELFKDGVLADGGMVATRTNAQVEDAVELTRRALSYAKDPDNVLRYGGIPEVTVTGHSLGGLLAQITAHHFNLRGETFNSYGAVSLGYRFPENSRQVINHVKASDVVSAGSRHFGEVRRYADATDIRMVGSLGGYGNDRSQLDIRSPGLAMGAGLLTAHNMHHFTHRDGEGKPDRSLLADPDAQRLAAEYRPMFDKYRDDVHLARAMTSGASTVVLEASERTGHTAGQVLGVSGYAVQTASQLAAESSRATGQITGAVAATGLHHAGQALAGAREAAAAVEAGIDHLQGQAQKQGAALGAGLLREAGGLLPHGVRQWMDTQAEQLQQAGEQAHRRNQAEAAAARNEGREDAAALRSAAQAAAVQTGRAAARIGDLQHEALSSTGQRVGETLRSTGGQIEVQTRRPLPQGEQPANQKPPASEPAASPPSPRELGQQTQAPTLPPHDFRDPAHPQHARYAQTLAAVHAMEADHGIAPSPNSEKVAAAFVDRMQQTGFQELARMELRGSGPDTELVALPRQFGPWDEKKPALVLSADQAVARSVEQATAAWAARALPHLDTTSSPPRVSLASSAQPHPAAAGLGELRGQIASAYAAAGIARSGEQIEQATAAVAVGLRQGHRSQADAVFLQPDRAGVFGPDSALIAVHGDKDDVFRHRSVTPAQELQRPSEDSYLQLAQLSQQQAREQALAHQHAQQQGQSASMGV